MSFAKEDMMVRNIARAAGSIAFTLLILIAAVPTDAVTLRQVQGAGQFRTISLEEQWRIDGHRADLVPIGWVAAAPNSDIAVAQPQDGRVLIFSAEGQLRGSFGRQGEGPGEFLNLPSGGFRGDTLWVYDGRSRRITFVSPSLQLIRTTSWPAEAAVLQIAGARVVFGGTYFEAVTPEGTILAQLFTPAIPAGTNMDPALVRRAIVGFDGQVRRIVSADEEVVVAVRFDVGGRNMGGPIPFAHRPFFVTNETGSRSAYLIADVAGPRAGTFSVTSFGAAGDTVFSRRYPFQMTTVPRAVADSAITANANRLETSTPGAGAAYRRAVQVAPAYYPVEDLISGRDGTTWIRLRPTNAAESRYLVLDPLGEPVGEAVLPAGVRIASADSQHAWGVSSDALGVESITKYAVSVAR